MCLVHGWNLVMDANILRVNPIAAVRNVPLTLPLSISGVTCLNMQPKEGPLEDVSSVIITVLLFVIVQTWTPYYLFLLL